MSPTRVLSQASTEEALLLSGRVSERGQRPFRDDDPPSGTQAAVSLPLSARSRPFPPSPPLPPPPSLALPRLPVRGTGSVVRVPFATWRGAGRRRHSARMARASPSPETPGTALSQGEPCVRFPMWGFLCHVLGQRLLREAPKPQPRKEQLWETGVMLSCPPRPPTPPNRPPPELGTRAGDASWVPAWWGEGRTRELPSWQPDPGSRGKTGDPL